MSHSPAVGTTMVNASKGEKTHSSFGRSASDMYSIRFIFISLFPASLVCNRRTAIITELKCKEMFLPLHSSLWNENAWKDNDRCSTKSIFFPSNLQQSFRSIKLALLVNLNFLTVSLVAFCSEIHQKQRWDFSKPHLKMDQSLNESFEKLMINQSFS